MHDPTAIGELRARAVAVLDTARSLGASDAFVSASREREVQMEMRAGVLEKVQQATSRSIRVQLWVNGRYGGHSTSDLRPEALQSFLRDAVALTAALQPDEDRRIPDPALYEGRSDADLQLLDPAVPALDRESRLAMLNAMQGAVEGTARLISAQSGVYDSHGVRVSVSSNGFEGHREAGSVTLGTEVTLQDDGDKRPEDGLYATARHLSDLPSPERLAADAAGWATDRLGMVKGPTAHTTMIVHPRASSRLVGRLLGPADGQSVQQGRSMWAGRVGEKLVSPALEIVDDPLLVRGLASRQFDEEGLAARRLPILAGGALQNLYLDTTYARKLDLPPTTGSASNRWVRPGNRDLDALIGATARGYLVTDWLGGNMDSTTGDFSFGVRGVQIERGQRAASVGEMNITGNILTLFASLQEVGNDPWPWRSLQVGTLVFDGVDFSGTA